MRRPLAAAAASLVLLLAGAARAEAPRWLRKEPKAPPSRIVTLAPSITEIVLELGAGASLVGVSRYDDAPQVARLPKVGGFLDPAPEAVLALRPDAVLAQPSPGNKGAVQRLADLGVPVLLLPLHSIEDIQASTRAVAKLLGEQARGEAAVARIDEGLAAVRQRTAELPKRRALVVYGWQPLVVAGPGTFADALLAAAGGENVAAAAGGAYPVFSAEAAVAASPDVVLDASGAHDGGAALPALAGKVHVVKSRALARPGPRLVEAVEELAAILHPASPR